MASPVVKLNPQHDPGLNFKSSRLHASVDSVPVDNPCDEKNKQVERKCNHFSIRGYVSEVRKRDPKICYPFSLKDSVDPGQDLPPMVVPNFRWWRCNSCVPEAKIDLMRDSLGAGNGEAHNAVNADASTLIVGQSSKVDAGKVRNTEASTSTDSNENKNHPSTSADLKRKGKAHVNAEIPLFSGSENGIVKVSVSQRNPQQTSGQIEVDLLAGSQVNINSRFNENGTITGLSKDCRAGRTEVGPSEGYVNRKVDRVVTIEQGEPQTSSQHQRVGSPTNGVAGIVSGSCSHSQGLDNVPNSNMYSGGPSYVVKPEATVTLNNINNFCEDDDDYLGAERRKKPKVRLLSELLGLTETHPSRGRKKIISSATSHDDHNKRKRVGFQEEGFKSTETNDGTKKNVDISEASESEYKSESDDASNEKISEALAKKICKSKDIPIPKRLKKIKGDNGDSSSMFRQKFKQKSGHDKSKVSEELPQNLDFFSRLGEKNSVLTKKRGRIPQAQKELTSSLTHLKSQIHKERGTTRKDGEPDQNATENARKASENGHYFLSSYLNKENDQLRVPRNEGLHVSSSEAQQIPTADNTVEKDRENGNIVEDSATFRTISTDVPSKVNQSNGESNIFQVNSTKKNTAVSEADECSRLTERMPMQVSQSVTNQKELTNEVRGRIQDIDINSIPTDDQSVEQGAGDDIPMDIVELMAKNQYERHLNEPKDKHDFFRPPVFSGTFARPPPPPTPTTTETYGSYGQHLKNFAQSHFLRMQRPPSPDPRIPTLFNEDLGHHAYSSNHVRSLPSFLSPSQGPGPGPYSARGLTPNNWNGNPHVQRYPPSFLQAVDSYQKQRGMAPRPIISDSRHLWPSGITSRMPLGITNPQMLSPSCNVLNKGHIRHPSPGSFLNFEKHQNLNFSTTPYNNGANPDNSAAASSVDVNEAIPAMHLLSLMQNSAKVQNTELSLGPQKVVGPTPGTRYPFSKNNGNRSSTIYDHSSSHPCYSTPRPFPLAFQNDGGNMVRNGAGFVGPIPLTLRGQRKMESSHFGPSSGDHHQAMRRPMGPPRDKGKCVASMRKPRYINNPFQAANGSSNLQYGTLIRHSEKMVSPAPDKVMCQLNQNPSEFNDLRLVAQFMIGPEDLKPRKTARSRAPRPKGNSKRQNMREFKPIPSLTAAKS